jgi:lysyl-tRNA synthetase, class I
MAQAWPYQEAQRLLNRQRDRNTPVVFETGYGPSGLPHIGTFTEVLRTQMIRRAYEELSDCAPTRLICFSDDMDALRKVPENVPNREMMEQHLGRSLTRVPDPFGTHESFAHHNNAMLREFLDRFGFEYEFMSSTEQYRSGAFNETLSRIFHNYDEVVAIIAPTLGEDRRETYSPFMPILPDGRVLDRGFLGRDIERELLMWDVDGVETLIPIHDGACKLQWKVDWALRWLALGVDYEMAGKDLTDSVALSSRIVRALGGQPPQNMIYEMFLDEQGRKISKSLGNGLTIEDWLRYGPQESLSFYLYKEPRKAKKLHVGLIPRAIDDYWQSLVRYDAQDEAQRRANPVHHVHSAAIPTGSLPVTFGLILNLIGILGEPDPYTVFEYIERNYTVLGGDELRRMIPYALAYHRDHLAGQLVRRPLDNAQERNAFRDLAHRLRDLMPESNQEAIQFEVYEVGKAHGYADNLRGWFQVIYEVVFGSPEGPRLGTFIEVYGLEEFASLLESAVADYDGVTWALAV